MWVLTQNNRCLVLEVPWELLAEIPGHILQVTNAGVLRPDELVSWVSCLKDVI